MKRLILHLASFLALAGSSWAALSASTVWEVRTAGNDTNGGGFVTGASGTDYSQQDTKNSGANDKSVTDGVTAGTTTITSATANFGTTIVGNIIYVSGGTGSITGGWYQVTVRNSATSITVDRSTGLTTGTGVTINIGGALATLAQLATNQAVVGQTAYVKADGTYSIGTGLTFGNASTSSNRNRVVGYTSTRTDNGRATVLATAAITMLTVSVEGWEFDNFIFDGNSATGTNGVNSSGGHTGLINCTIKNLSGYGVRVSIGGLQLVNVEISGCGTTAGLDAASGFIGIALNIHDNTVPGISYSSTSAFSLTSSVIESNSGATSDGLFCSTAPAGAQVQNCVFYNNGRSGIRLNSATNLSREPIIANNIFEANGAYGIDNNGGSSTRVMACFVNNAYYNNTTNPRNGFAAEAGAVTLTGSPFVDAANTNFGLNTTTGAGAACRAAGLPGVILGTATTTGHLDIGAAQHADPAGGETSAVFVN